MTKYLSALLWFSLSAMASIAPSNFPSNQSQHTFVDFTEANYSIKYDIKNKKVSAYSVITFEQKEQGQPLFDLLPNATEVKINGEETKMKTVSAPDKTTSYRTIDKVLSIGTHKLEIRNSFSNNLKFEESGVQSAFWMSDLKDRKYLEQYLPTNIEFDQYKMNLNIKFANTSVNQVVYSNGDITKASNTEYSIEFPKYFTASSMFFHTATEGRFEEKRYDFKSINGNVVPVIVYGKKSFWGGSTVTKAVKQSKSVLTELESKLGAWSHKSVVIYSAGGGGLGLGGMEYSGATMTSLGALGHELTHSYFARGVMPIDGNSGWMDEAIASWRDDGYKSVKKPNFSSTSMAAHSQYRRTTDDKAYNQGSSFMSYLNYNLKNLGGLEAFLSKMYEKYTHKNINTEMFRAELEAFSGLNFEKDFNKYIYGQGKKALKAKAEKKNPYHPKLTREQLLDLL